MVHSFSRLAMNCCTFLPACTAFHVNLNPLCCRLMSEANFTYSSLPSTMRLSGVVLLQYLSMRESVSVNPVLNCYLKQNSNRKLIQTSLFRKVRGLVGGIEYAYVGMMNVRGKNPVATIRKILMFHSKLSMHGVIC